MSHVLVELLPTRAKKDEWSRWIGGFDGGEDGLGTHEHSGATTKRGVIHGAMDIGRMIANVVIAQIDGARGSSTTQEAVRAEPVDHLGEQGEDIDAHDVTLPIRQRALRAIRLAG
jgi:hypothetical protein